MRNDIIKRFILFRASCVTDSECSLWGGSEATAPPVWAHCGDEESLPVALLVVSTNSSGHDREEAGSKEWGGGGSASELADGSQNMKQCRGNVWWVRCTELQAREQACWGNYSLMGSFGRQLPGVNVVWRDEVRLKWNFWLENVFKWKGSRQTSCALMGWEVDWGKWNAGVRCHTERREAWSLTRGLNVHTGAFCSSLSSLLWPPTGAPLFHMYSWSLLLYLAAVFLLSWITCDIISCFGNSTQQDTEQETKRYRERCVRETTRGTSENEDKKDHYALLR